MKYRIIYSFLICCFAFQNANAQIDDGYILPEKIEVVKEYEPILANSKKLEINAEMPEITDNKTKVNSNYVNNPKFISSSFEPPKLKPLAASKQRVAQTKNIWIKAGMGAPKNPYVDATLQSGISKKMNAGAQFIFDRVEEETIKSHTFINGNVFAKRIGTNSVAEAKLGYSDFTHNFYGKADSNAFNLIADSVKQKFNDIELVGNYSNMFETRSGFNYNAGLKVNFLNNGGILSEDFPVSDFNIVLDDTYVRKSLDDNYFGVGANVQFDNYTIQNPLLVDTLQSRSDLIAYLTPHFYADKLGLSIGANVAWANEEIQIFPSIKLNKTVNDDIAIYGVWNKAPKQNTYRNLLIDNPFASKSLNIVNSNVEERFVGFKYKIKTFGEFNIKAGQQIVENMPLWLVDFNSETENRYHVVYDSSLTTLKVKPQINLEVKDFEIKTFAEFNTYTLTNELQAWHLPNNILSLAINYKGVKDLQAGIEMINVGERKALNKAGNEEVLNPYFDLNLSANYKINQNFSIFLEGKNLLNTTYQNWYLYNNYLAQFRVGILAKL